MRRNIPYILISIMAVLAAGFAVLSWNQAHTSAHVTIYDCSTNAVASPKEFILSCADFNSKLVNLQWSAWGDTTAYATGTATWNDCTPDCAAGTWKSAPITVWAYRIRGGHYTRLWSDQTSLFSSGPFEAQPYPPSM